MTSVESDLSGLEGSASVSIVGPFGAKFTYANMAFSAEGQDSDYLRMTPLATYALPVTKGEITALAGYSTMKLVLPNFWSGVSSIVVGAEGSFSPIENVALSGSAMLGINGQFSNKSGDSADAGYTALSGSASYGITPSLSVEAGYGTETYEIRGDFPITLKKFGCFAGLRLDF